MNVLSCVDWFLDDDMDVVWRGECVDNEIWHMIIMDDNLVLRTIHMCENELIISFGKFLLLLEVIYLG